MPGVSASKYLVQAGQRWHRPDREKTCVLCGVSKPLGEFYSYGYVTRQGKESTRYESRCKPCARKRRRDTYDMNPKASNDANRRWRQRNAEQQAEYAKQYRSSDHGKRVKAKCQRLRKARIRSGQPDCPAIRAIYAEALRVEQIVACCPVFAIPELGYKMHVDHIRPLSKGGKHVASNLQIIPIGINMRKGVKWPK